MRVVIDANVVLSAILKDRKPEEVILFVRQASDFEWVASAEILAEYTKVIQRISSLEEGFYATQRYCIQTFVPLDGGKLVEGCQIQCPFHRARFDVRTGAVVLWANFLPGTQLPNAVRNEQPLKTYPVQVRDGQVFVEI